MKLSTKHLVAVRWDDAHMSLDEYSEEDILQSRHQPEPVMSYGLLIADTEKGITIAMQEGVEDKKFRQLLFIPRAMVLETINLGIPQQRKKKPSSNPSSHLT